MNLPCTGRVKVTLAYREGLNGPYPWKWRGECTCGWTTLSWSWSRQWDCYTVSGDPDQWIEDNGQPYGGTLINALEHVGLITDPGTYWA